MSSAFPATSTTAAILLIGLVGMLGPAPGAMAGEVHFDPQSPAGKEYALPLPQARSEALGTEGEGSPEAAPLFGVGIDESGAAAKMGGGGHGGTNPGAAGGEKRSHKGNGSTPASRGGGHGGPPAGGEAGSSRPIVLESASYEPGGAIALIAGLLLLAVLAGMALRFGPSRRASD